MDLVAAHLERIAQVDARIHSFIHVAGDRAHMSAQIQGAEIKAGRRRSMLQGIPFAVKDNYDVAGLPATAGSRLRLDNVPNSEATLDE